MTALMGTYRSGGQTQIVPLDVSANGVLRVESGTATAPIAVTGTITNGTLTGAAQNVLAAKAGRAYLEFQNNSTGDMWLNFSGTAAVNSGYKIPAGGGWYPASGWIPAAAISVFGTGAYAVGEA